MAGVRVGRNGPLRFVDAGDLEMTPGELVLVDCDRATGPLAAYVAITPELLLRTDGLVSVGRVVGRPKE